MRELGRGGTGTVFEARDLVLGQRIAVKVLHPDRVDEASRERLRREVRAARPGHPSAVAVYELHDTDGLHYLTLELVDGESLRTAVAAGRQLEVAQVTAIGRQVAEALAHLHRRGLVHRDVKPGNILLAADGVAKLCDLGLARPVAEGVTVTETEMVVGTPAYMAPEQALGVELQSASDVYALGITLCQALTGEVPLRADTALATLSRRQRERPPSVRMHRPECPRWLDGLLRRMLDPDPRERPTAAQVARALAEQRSLWRPRRRQLAVAGLALAALAAIALAVPWLTATDTVEIQVSTDAVSGLGSDGSVTWTRRFETPVVDSEVVDLDGDGRDEVVVASEGPQGVQGRQEGARRAEIEVRRLDGQVVTSLQPDTVVRWSYAYPVELTIRFATLDLDHDGVLEIVAVCSHRTFYPTAVLVYWTGLGQWEHLLNHAGYIYDFEELWVEDGEGFWFRGVNNELGMLPVLGRVSLAPYSGARNIDESVCASPPEGTGFGGRVSLDPYVVMGEAQGEVSPLRSLLPATGDGVRLERADGGVLHIDRFGNQSPGPNEGLDLRAERRYFVQRLIRLSDNQQPDDPDEVRQIHRDAVRRTGRLLDEKAYRVALELLTARSLARAGDVGGALELLRSVVADAPWDDPMLRLAHLEAVSGNLETAGSVLWAIMQRSVRPRARYDAPLLHADVAIARRDPDAVVQSSRLPGRGWAGDAHIIEVGLMARARLWWDRVEDEDLEPVSSNYLPAAEAVACLARWRRGQLRPDDDAAMARRAEQNPDVSVEFRVAEAAALLGSGRAGEALGVLGAIDAGLERSARGDFSHRQLLELERALRALALAAAGHPDRARELARQMRAEVDPELLPGILVRELLADLEP